MSEQLHILDKNDERYQVLLNQARNNVEFSSLEKIRLNEGYEIDYANPQLTIFTSETEITVAELAVFEVKKAGEVAGSIVYYKNAKEAGAIANLKGEGSEANFSYYEEGKLQEEKVDFSNQEESAEVLAKISMGTCVKAVTVVCGAGLGGTMPACVSFCATTGPGIVVCTALCAILVGGGCWLGAETVCNMVL